MKSFWPTTVTKVFLLLCTNGIQAQETVAASGGNATGNSGSVSYSVGQVVFTANTSTNGTIIQGVQQPYEILLVNGIEEAVGINLEMMVYPNPASDFLKLMIEDYNLENLIYQLYDINGSLIENGKIVGNETIIQTGELSPATYYLRISDIEKDMKTFKIVKN